ISTPAVPTIVSSSTAAIVGGPSIWMTCSRCCSARSHSCCSVVAQNADRYRYGPKKCTCLVANSFGHRRVSPVEAIAASAPPFGEENLLHAVRRQRRDPGRGLAPRLVRVLRRDRGEFGRLRGDRGGHPRVLVPDAGVHQLAGEVQ